MNDFIANKREDCCKLSTHSFTHLIYKHVSLKTHGMCIHDWKNRNVSNGRTNLDEREETGEQGSV